MTAKYESLSGNMPKGYLQEDRRFCLIPNSAFIKWIQANM